MITYQKDTFYTRYTLDDEGILLAVFHGESRMINLETAKKMVADRKALGLPPNLLLLLRNDAGFTFDKAARTYLSAKEGAEGFLAAAVLIRNPIDLATVRFMAIFGKPPIPMSYFSDLGKARAWLKRKGEILRPRQDYFTTTPPRP